MRRVLGAVLAAGVLTLAGCGSSSAADGGSRTSDATGAGASCGPAVADPTAGGCPGFTAGKDGVIQTFCDGPGAVKITAGKASGEIKGLTCSVAGGYFTAHGGVVVRPDYAKAKPDYAGFLFPEKGGAFTGATIRFTIGGKGHIVTMNSGTVDVAAKKGSFTGKDLDGSAVAVSFTC